MFSKVELINACKNIFRLDGGRDTPKNIFAFAKLQDDILKGKVTTLEEIRKRSTRSEIMSKRSDEKKNIEHQCPDGTIYKWKSRVENPRSCPRCKQYLKEN